MVKKASRRNLEDYLKLRYPIQVVECEEGGYFAKIPDLRGCMTQGETLEEVMANIQDAKLCWLEGAIESEYEIPLPSDMRQYSGKFLVRLPVSLHERLVAEAERESVSLNSYVAALLAERNAFRVAARKAANSVADEKTGVHARARGQPRMIEHVAEKSRVKYRAG